MTESFKQAGNYFDQGMAHVRERDFGSAADSFRRATEADPDDSRAQNNLGSTLAALGRHEEAVSAFRRAIQIDPNYAQAHFNLGASLQMLGFRQEAFDCFLRTVEIDPRHEEAYFYLGREHQAEGRPNEALACYLQAVELTPDEADIYTSMASVLARLRLPGMAARALEKALSFNPDDSLTRTHLIDQLARDCDWEKLEAHREWIPRLGVVGAPVPPFAMLTFDDDPERNLIRSRRFVETFPPVEQLPVAARPTSRPDRLRIGYFSADFHDHATMFLAARMFELRDRRFSIHAYSYGAEQGGAMRERAKKAFDEFKDVADLSYREIAEMARNDGIDIAVDLKGHTEFQRLGIFAHRPAPIQMTYLGYPGTIGAPFIDYNIVDRIVVPDDQRHGYSEQLIYLPNSYQANDDKRVLPMAGMTRSDAGLPDEAFVFCCFNYSYKISPAEFGIWTDLLKQIEGSVLWMLSSPGNMQTNLGRVMQSAGVDPSRLIITPRVKLQDHMTRLRLADLFLDTFNCNAHTTASDTLWAGVPFITKAGRGFPSRVAASLLNAVGLPELITTSERDYADLALALARDPARLAAIRAKLENNRSTAPLFDSALFTRHIEQGYDMAFDRYLKGQPPMDIVVPN